MTKPATPPGSATKPGLTIDAVKIEPGSAEGGALAGLAAVLARLCGGPAARATYAAVGSEQRRAFRKRLRLRSGKLVDERHRFIAECIILDRSSHGARLRLLRESRLPQDMFLYDDHNATLSEIRASWSDGSLVGVAIVRTALPDDAKAARIALGAALYGIPD
jgi:hypothetical protein